MWIKKSPAWALPEQQATPESIFHDRRRLLAAAASSPLLIAAAALPLAACDDGGVTIPSATAPTTSPEDPSAPFYPVRRNLRYRVGRAATDEALASSHNNFMEFGSHKRIWQAAQALAIRPWRIEIDGLVEAPMSLDIDDLLARMTLEERVYRHRCVEAWSMVVPWTGFPLSALIDLAKPLSDAKYLRLQSFDDPKMASGQAASWYPWPYAEGLTLAEAGNELAFMVTGAYGKPLAKQYGAPLRLAVPWKYGFKHIKSVQRISFTDKRPDTFWSAAQGDEYGFWANVNPAVPHRRWSQAKERPLGAEEKIPTKLFNGYGEFVAGLYKNHSGEKLYF